jgi:hypothetical protein
MELDYKFICPPCAQLYSLAKSPQSNQPRWTTSLWPPAVIQNFLLSFLGVGQGKWGSICIWSPPSTTWLSDTRWKFYEAYFVNSLTITLDANFLPIPSCQRRGTKIIKNNGIFRIRSEKIKKNKARYYHYFNFSVCITKLEFTQVNPGFCNLLSFESKP